MRTTHWFVDNKLSIHFGEDKTKTILFSSINRSKNAYKIEIRRHDVILKQFRIVEYLGCLLDCSLSGEQMALKVLGKINGRLKMLYREGKYLGQRLRRKHRIKEKYFRDSQRREDNIYAF